MQVHKGHRQRMKRRFLEHGLDNFDDVNVLELLLFYADPRRDTNPLAHALLDQFGSLAGVLEAAPGDLEKIPGIGENRSHAAAPDSGGKPPVHGDQDAGDGTGGDGGPRRGGTSFPGLCISGKSRSKPCTWTPGKGPSAAGN